MDIEKFIDQGFRVKEYPKDAVVYAPGMKPRFVYFIQSGEIRMVTVSEDGKEFIQGIFKSGDYFGEPALILDKPYLAYTIVNKATKIVPVARKDFFAMIKAHPDFSLDLIRTLSDRLFYKSMMLEELANEKAEHRLSTIIRHLAEPLKDGEVLDVTRQDLADMTGLRVETVIRAIKTMALHKTIKLRKGKILK
ncbi:Crp/Fnr family transcriptional regulator [Pedobacter sp. AW1-32]|uniref:Crp/Fnr family transcriptional regulator n=1 Tax=Pedobacter sp. AW1-32 TaxID=3383026 RepID=UPI003FF0A156